MRKIELMKQGVALVDSVLFLADEDPMPPI
jgi:hypothetical protein